MATELYSLLSTLHSLLSILYFPLSTLHCQFGDCVFFFYRKGGLQRSALLVLVSTCLAVRITRGRSTEDLVARLPPSASAHATRGHAAPALYLYTLLATSWPSHSGTAQDGIRAPSESTLRLYDRSDTKTTTLAFWTIYKPPKNGGPTT